MHFEGICAHLSPKSSLTRNPEEEKTQGQKVNRNNNPSWIYKFSKHVLGKQRSLSVNFRDEPAISFSTPNWPLNWGIKKLLQSLKSIMKLLYECVLECVFLYIIWTQCVSMLWPLPSRQDCLFIKEHRNGDPTEIYVCDSVALAQRALAFTHIHNHTDTHSWFTNANASHI